MGLVSGSVVSYEKLSLKASSWEQTLAADLCPLPLAQLGMLAR